MSLPPRRPTSSELQVPNIEYRIPAEYDDKTAPAVPFEPTAFVRVLIDAKPDGAHGLRFTATVTSVEDISMHLNPLGHVESQVEGMFVKYESPPVTPLFAAKSLEFANKAEKETFLPVSDPIQDILNQIANPLSIDLPDPQQGYIVLQLNPAINWCFSRNSYGITTKNFHADDNFGIRFLDNNKTFTEKGARAPMEHSRLVYFAFARRDEYTPQSFNFHIEYIWTDAGMGYRIPMIFDPDIPSSGGGSIP